MPFRCPYCRQELGPEPVARCPACGRTMLVPRMRESTPRVRKKRAIEAIWRENERKKAELHAPFSPASLHNPKFYFGMVVILAVLGGAMFRATDRAVDRRREPSPYTRAMRHVDVLAEALGRYRFHTGVFPSDEQGLAALVRTPGVPLWRGPYINLFRSDPWDTPFVYHAPTNGGFPALYSCGPDRTPGTADDLYPDPARFDPGTAWTNGWVSAGQRIPGVRILPSGR